MSNLLFLKETKEFLVIFNKIPGKAGRYIKVSGPYIIAKHSEG